MPRCQQICYHYGMDELVGLFDDGIIRVISSDMIIDYAQSKASRERAQELFNDALSSAENLGEGDDTTGLTKVD